MPTFALTTNTPRFLASSIDKKAEFLFKASQMIAQETLFFIAAIKLKMMSFPRSGPPQSDGTRVQTGMLRRNWFNQVVAPNQAIQAKVWSTTPYAPMHEYGGDFDRVSSRGKHFVVHMPKRLHVGQAWVADFLPNMRKAINTAYRTTIGNKVA